MPATRSLIRHIAVPHAETDIFATAEFQEDVTLWSMIRHKKLAEIRTVLDFGRSRLAVVQQPGTCLVTAASFYGPVNTYDLEGNVVWSRRDLVGIQQLTSIPNGREPMIGVALRDQDFRILGALDGKELSKLDGVKEVYASTMTTRVLAVTSRRSVCLRELDSAPLWERPLKSFGILHSCLSSNQVAYSEAAGDVYCFDLNGEENWTLRSEPDHHFIRVAWNQSAERWMAIDWGYAQGGPKQLFEISQTGTPALVADLGGLSEVEFFANGDHLVTSNGNVLDAHSGLAVWNFLQE